MVPNEAAFYATGANFFLRDKDFDGLAAYLNQQDWLFTGEQLVDTYPAGEGNMNLTLRILTNKHTYILKQARPWVEKYPQIPAPVERNAVEAAYWTAIGAIPSLQELSPDILGHDQTNHILLLQDLGAGSDLSIAYQKGKDLSLQQSELLLRYLSTLHHLEPPLDFPPNLALRQLNHEHIFIYPYLDQSQTGFDLENVQKGLTEIAAPIRTNQALLKMAKACGERYLNKGSSLLHGDFYPGSWLQIEDKTFVIDPEFAFVGPPEYDLGIYLAHLYLTNATADVLQAVKEHYHQPVGFDEDLVRQFCGLEMIRRLIGLAQLPLEVDLDQRAQWLAKAEKMVVMS
ncbi:MAG: phosphotransferase, partial [Bacteroidota bacterium]